MATRERLPPRRHAVTFDFEHAGLKYTATVGRFADGRPAELSTCLQRLPAYALAKRMVNRNRDATSRTTKCLLTEEARAREAG
jgi:hypothetical protein